MEQTANKIQEYMRAERRKLKTEMTELKNLVVNKKASLEGLTNRITTAPE